jgi:hypothetical protein
MKRRVYSNTVRSRALRTSVVLALSVLPIGALLAQGEDADAMADLKACATIERNNARLACYDGVLGRPASPPEPAATTTVNPPPPQTTAPEGPAPAAVAGAAAAGSAAVAATEGAARAAPEAAANAPPAPPPETDTRRTIVVTEVRLRTPSSAVFITDSGQIWEQTDSGRGRYPKVPFEAALESGSLGSTFLVSPAGGPRIRVRLRE